MGALAESFEALEHHIVAIDSDSTWSLHGRIGSALLWVCAIDEAFWSVEGYEAARDRDEDGRVIPGLRRARNAVTHELVRAHQAGGLEYPLSYPMTYPDVWVPLPALGPARPSPKVPAQERSYVAEVEGQRVDVPLKRARDWLARQVNARPEAD